jgi:pimeloyl-ACP methyl ester carboxylesterase
MPTTVRILGSRAREQLPGTSITLRAPGFRGAVTQLAASAASPRVHSLPFKEAAADAEVMLAAHLALHLEARPSEGEPGLRSRSALATHPRLIVPRRKGIAYALLQTDEDGVSSFIFSETHESDEAVFPLTVVSGRTTHRTLRVFMWPAQQVQGPGVLAAVSRFERQHRPNRIAQIAPNGGWRAPDWDALARGPALLLLHGTFGTPQAAFDDWLCDESFARVLDRYHGRCIAFAHPTLSVSPDENLDWLCANTPRRQDCVDIVAHGRGGLLARLIAADGRVPVRRACLIGTPNRGTPLAGETQLPRYLDGHVALLARARRHVSEPTLQGALSLARCMTFGSEPSLPGLEAMAPDSLLLRALGAFGAPAQQWFTIGAQYSGAGAVLNAGDPAEFGAQPNDLVVPSEGCHDLGRAVTTESLKLGGADVHHHGYFSNTHVRARLDAWLE